MKKKAAKKAPAKKAPAKKAPAKKVAAKKPAKKPAKKAVVNESKRVYHVVKRDDGKWEVKFAGGEKAIKLFDRQDEAVVYSRQMSKNQKGAMLVHNSKCKNKGRIKAK